MSDTSIQAAPRPAPRPTGVALDSDKDEKCSFSTDGMEVVSSEIIDSTKAVHSGDGDSTGGNHNHIIHTLMDSNGNEDTSTSNTVHMDSDKQLESTTNVENDTITDTNNTHLDSETDTVYAPTQTQHNDEISESVEADSQQLGDEDTDIVQIENTSQNTQDTLSDTHEAFGGDTSTYQPVSATHNTQGVSPSEPHEAIAHGTTEPSGLKTSMEALEASGSISALTSSHPDTIADSGTTHADSISVYSGEGEDTELVAENAKSPKLVLNSSASQMDSSAATAAGNPMLRTAKSLHTMTVRSEDTTVDSASGDQENPIDTEQRGASNSKPAHVRSSSYAALTVHAANARTVSEGGEHKLSSPSTESAVSEGHTGISPHRRARMAKMAKMKQKSKTTLSWSGFNETITDNDINVDLTVRTAATSAPRKTTPSPTLETVDDKDESPSEAFEHTGVLIRCELEEMDIKTLTMLHDNLQKSLAALNRELVHVLNVREEAVTAHEQKEVQMAEVMNTINDLSDTKSFEALAGNERLKKVKSSSKKK